MIARARPVLAVLGLATLLLLAGCGADEAAQPGQPGSTLAPTPPGQSGQSGQPGAGAPLAQANCTKQAADAAAMTNALAGAAPGDRICLTGDMGETRVALTRSGTLQQPIVVLGGGHTTAGGITVEASNVAIDGVAMERPEAPGISLTGNNIAVTNNTVHRPHGGDGDGIRFFGSNITVAHNTISDTRGQDKRHADCMQTFATDEQHPASQDVKIDSNRCENIDNICLIAEGPNSEAGDGSGEGESTRFDFTNNYCDNKAGQAVMLDNITHVRITGNQIVGKIDKAFALQNETTAALVRDNQLNHDIGYEVGIDDSSAEGYSGPEPGGAP